MFGNKNKGDLEDLTTRKTALEEIVKQLAVGSQIYEANRSEVVSSQRQMVANMNQIAANYLDTRQYAEANTQAQDELMQTLTDAVQRMKLTEAQRAQLEDRIRAHLQQCVGIIEQDKHFTSPSKKISEGVSALYTQQRERTRTYKQATTVLDAMGQDMLLVADASGRVKMSEDALLAIEQMQHRLEDVRMVLQQQEEKNQAQAQEITDLSDQVRYLVGLLKENNMAMAQMMRELDTTVRTMERAEVPVSSADASQWREGVQGMHDADAEILKIQERNRIQLEDVAEEIQTQNRAEKEIRDTLTPVFAKAKGYGK